MPDLFDHAVSELRIVGDESIDDADRALRLADAIHHDAVERFGPDDIERSLDPLATCLHGRVLRGDAFASLVLLSALCSITADLLRRAREPGRGVRAQFTRPLLEIVGDLLFANADAFFLSGMWTVIWDGADGFILPIDAGALSEQRTDDGTDHLISWCSVHLWTVACTLIECQGDWTGSDLSRIPYVVSALRTLDRAHFMHSRTEDSGSDSDDEVEGALDALFAARSRLTGRLAQYLREVTGIGPPAFCPPFFLDNFQTYVPGYDDWERPIVREACETIAHLGAGELDNILRSLASAINAGLDADDDPHVSPLRTAQLLRMVSCGIALGLSRPKVYGDGSRFYGEVASFVRDAYQTHIPETCEPGLPRAFRSYVEGHLEALSLAVEPRYLGANLDIEQTSIWLGRSDLSPVTDERCTDHIIANALDRLRAHDQSPEEIDLSDDGHRRAMEELSGARRRLLTALEDIVGRAERTHAEDEATCPPRSVVIPLKTGISDAAPTTAEVEPDIADEGLRRRRAYVPPVPRSGPRDLTNSYLLAAEEHARRRDEVARHSWRTDDDRFSRQEAVPGWDQSRLRRAVAVVVGLGGLGAAVVDQLARMGVGTIRAVDHDRVEDSNISRQCLYLAEDVGWIKADAAEKRVRMLRGPTRVVPRPAFLCERNALMLVAGADVVFDCLDSEDAKRLLNRACARAGVPLVHGGCTGFIGQAMAVVPGRTACMACRELTFSAADTASCTRDNALPIIAPTAQLVASLQVDLALHVLMGTGDVPSGLLLYDGRAPGFRSVPIERREDCPVCGGGRTTEDEVRAALSRLPPGSLLQIAGTVGMEHADGRDAGDLVDALVDLFSALPDGSRRALRLVSGVQYLEEAIM